MALRRPPQGPGQAASTRQDSAQAPPPLPGEPINVEEVYASGDWLKASDIGDKPVTLYISQVYLDHTFAEKQGGPDVCLAFEATEKHLRLNKTNALAIAEKTGSKDARTWVGKEITLMSVPVMFNNRMVPGLRVI